MRMMRLAAVVLVLGCGGAGKPAPAPAPAAAHAELAATIDALAADALARQGAGGISIAVVWRGETVIARGYGLADVEHRTPADADTVFRIASISKQLTGKRVP